MQLEGHMDGMISYIKFLFILRKFPIYLLMNVEHASMCHS